MKQMTISSPSRGHGLPRACSDPAGSMSTTRTATQCGCANVPLRILAKIGLWGDARDWLRRCAPLLTLAQATYGLVTQMINLAQTWGKMALAAEFCVALLLAVMTCVKVRCLMNRAVPIQQAVATLDEMYDAHARTDDVTHILRRTRKASDKFADVMHVYCACALAVFSVALCVGGYRKREIPFRRWYPFDATVSPMFDLALLARGALTFLDIYVILLFDLLVLCLLIEVIGEFQVLQYRLARIARPATSAFKPADKATFKRQGNALLRPHPSFKERRHGKLRHFVGVAPARGIRRLWPGGSWEPCFGDKPSKPVAQVETSEQRLAACVIHHQALIRLVSKLESTFQPALIMHLVCNFCVGITLVYATLKSDKLEMKLISMLAIGFVCVTEFALYCYFCALLTTESTRVGEAIYACAWWETSAGFKRSLRIVQLRTGHPVCIRASIMPMSMETFAQVMKIAYNVYGLLITTN